MVRVRNLVLAIAAATALTSEMAHALGLGEVRLQSALNQPLVAEIELLDSSSLAAGEVIPSLASVEEFNKAGVDRQYFLTDLKFTPVLRPNGKSVIQVTSSKPVREPYLNFLVEVLWPNGRLLREYTLLLDPPLYSPETVAAAAPQLPIAAQAPRQTASRPAAPAPAPRAAAPSVSSSTTPAPAALQGDEYRTSARDTLWDIAERTRKGGTVHQAMLAIQDLNPDAFIDGNINRMKSGQVLRLPDAEQVGSRSQAEAIAQVAEQNAAWRQGRAVAAGRQLDATQRSTAGAAPSRSETGDSLRLVAPQSGASTSGSDRGTGTDVKALNDKLAVTQESLDSSRRENAELQDRLGDLQGQLEKLQRLMQLKDDQLAKLQAQLAAEGAAANTPQNTGQYEAGTPSTAAPPGSSGNATPSGADDGADSSDMAAPADPAGAAMSDTNTSVPPAAAQAPAAKPAPQPAPAPAPAPAAQQQPESGILDNPMMLGLIGGGALLLLLVGLMALSRRNAMKEAELQDSFAEDERSNFYASEQAYPNGSFDSVDDHAAQKEATPVAQASEQVTAQTGDALGEADIYIAYGRFNQAAELLQNALNDEPHRSELRLKLMEVYAELGDREGFAREEAELREIGGANAGIEQLKSKCPTMGFVAPAAAASAGYAAAAYQQNDQNDDLGLDDLDLGEPAAQSNATLDTDEFALSLDELDLADEPVKQETQAARASDEMVLDNGSSSQEDDFSFDLGLDDEIKPAAASQDAGSDFSFDLEDEPKAAESTSGDDFLLSLDDDLSEAPQTSKGADDFSFDLPKTEAADASLPDDFDLSLDDEPAAEAASEEDFAAQLDEVDAELDALSQRIDESRNDAADLTPAAAPAVAMDDLGEDFDFLSGTDETSTKLDLARAYIDMGDAEGARDILDEVIGEGNDSQQQEAREMLARLA
ncbi:peptigoglycan-binding protein LysM [Stutzerimonas nosocomialis]|uniref:Peptigoglycan-binding protein LysM n=1 Tax=Stutzerimonas nosocomialis TaxID=1056496 RepID=A0A5R9QJV1_9GAMM|nr:FimV/HubP family polar landmark protein [Stutzerimonas nosocomialis]TLX65262.1 peptigoglycan-binding protein LysM [Stutzerimonas nosocomialis]